MAARSAFPDTEPARAADSGGVGSAGDPGGAVEAPVPFGKYYLLERLDDEGRTEVFRAREGGNEARDTVLAIKCVPSGMAANRAAVEQFASETETTARLHHACIARIIERGWVGPTYFVALEHVFGRDLRTIQDRLHQRGARMPASLAAYILMRMCEGLAYAHAQQGPNGAVLHRNVSPKSVLVSFDGEVKLINFGMAKTQGRRAKTVSGIVKGTYGYMSPEQVRGLPLDQRSDVFSCGIVLHELLTGTRVFDGDEEFDVLEKVRTGDFLPPSAVARKVPEELERIVLKAMAKHADERYQNAADMQDDLRAFLFVAGALHARRDLATWLRRVFEAELTVEQGKMEHFRRLALPRREMLPPPPERSAQPASSASTASGGKRRPREEATEPMRPQQRPGAKPSWAEAETRMYGATAAAAAATSWDKETVMAAGVPAPELGATRPYGTPRSMAPAAEPGGEPAATGAGTPVGTPAGTPAGPMPAAPNASNAPTVQAMPAATGVPTAPNAPTVPAMPAASATSRGVPMPGVAAIAMPALQVGLPHPPTEGPPRRRGLVIAAVAMGASALLAAGGVAGFYLVGGVLAKGEQPAPAEPGVALSAEVRAATGFDLFVVPDTATVKLDGRALEMRVPIRERDLAPGPHELEVIAPDGYYSQTRTIVVEAGQAERHLIELDRVGTMVRFSSEPPGAQVSLVVDGNDGEPLALGPSPSQRRLDPRRRYEAVFELDGYETARVEITEGQVSEGIVAVALVVADGADEVFEADEVGDVDDESGAADEPDRSEPAPARAVRRRAPRRRPARQAPAATGLLMLGAKPPCRIYIDGKDTGKLTPQRNLRLPAGRRRVRLVNKEHGIDESFTVTVEPDETVRVVKDMSDRLR
ncbi:protein kinase domain-containing protein [Haliangium sp.]|uniref:protein kinase domain-containing protein n=1 Tax=Haliangium sp. TaxID=2663208 RepID=UPI003D13BA9C